MESEKIKDFYDRKIKRGDDYERKRWFSNVILKAGYDMTLTQIKTLAFPAEFADCLELGPGHGTWTDKLLSANPDASYDLVDISGGMLSLAKERFKNRRNIRYFQSNFLDFKPDKKYDFFFSIRAFEYLPDKDLAVKKISELLIFGGRGFIVTKTPKYLRKKFLGIEVPEIHKGQIAPAALYALLVKYGFGDIEIYPVTLSMPVINFAKTNRFLFKLFGKLKLNFVSQFFSESYCVKFKKL